MNIAVFFDEPAFEDYPFSVEEYRLDSPLRIRVAEADHRETVAMLRTGIGGALMLGGTAERNAWRANRVRHQVREFERGKLVNRWCLPPFAYR